MAMSLEERQCEKVLCRTDSARSMQEKADNPACTIVRLQLS